MSKCSLQLQQSFLLYSSHDNLCCLMLFLSLLSIKHMNGVSLLVNVNKGQQVFGATSCTGVKIQRRAKIQTTVLRGGYVVRIWCISGPKAVWVQTTFDGPEITCAYNVVSNNDRWSPTSHPTCSNPEEDSVNEKGLVAETSAQSINRKLGSYGRGDKLSARGTTMDGFFLQAHTDLSLRLTGGNTHSLTEGCTDENP
jgi:hypothetical protein